MKQKVESFLLRMLLLAAALGAMCFVGVYAEGRLCAEMLLTPACLAIARAAWQTEKHLGQSAGRASALHLASPDPDPARAA